MSLMRWIEKWKQNRLIRWVCRRMSCPSSASECSVGSKAVVLALLALHGKTCVGLSEALLQRGPKDETGRITKSLVPPGSSKHYPGMASVLVWSATLLEKRRRDRGQDDHLYFINNVKIRCRPKTSTSLARPRGSHGSLHDPDKSVRR
jgi:hypothetical protein